MQLTFRYSVSRYCIIYLASGEKQRLDETTTHPACQLRSSVAMSLFYLVATAGDVYVSDTRPADTSRSGIGVVEREKN